MSGQLVDSRIDLSLVAQRGGPLVSTPLGRVRRLFYDRAKGEVLTAVGQAGRDLSLDPEAVSMFLLLGFVPGTKTLFRQIECLPGGSSIALGKDGYDVLETRHYHEIVSREDFRGKPWAQLLREAERAWLAAISGCYESGGEITLPLSGGLDSRAILAGLLEHTEAGRIRTVTRGVPGSPDFAWGRKVAKAVGTRHVQIDLRDVPIRLDGLLRTARLTDGNTNLFDAHYNLLAIERSGGAEYWSGHMGDPSCGVLQPLREISGGNALYQYFCKANDLYNPRRLFVEPATHARCRRLVLSCLDEITVRNSMTPYEIVDFLHRQERLINNIVVSAELPAKTPFLSEEWLEFALSLPRELRRRRYFHVRFLLSFCPALMSIPSTEFRSLPVTMRMRKLWVNRRRVLTFVRRKLCGLSGPSYTIYIDFDEGVRSRQDLRQIVHESVHDLDRRGILPKGAPCRLLREHLDRQADHGMVLCLLTSLEIILKAFNVKC